MKRLTKDEATKKMEELLIEAGWDYTSGINKITFDTTYFEECYDEDGSCGFYYWRLTERDGIIYFVECDEQGEVLKLAFDEEVSEFFCLDNPSEVEDIRFLISDILTPSDYQSSDPYEGLEDLYEEWVRDELEKMLAEIN